MNCSSCFAVAMTAGRVSIFASEPAEQGERSLTVRVATRRIGQPVAQGDGRHCKTAPESSSRAVAFAVESGSHGGEQGSHVVGDFHVSWCLLLKLCTGVSRARPQWRS